MRRKTPPPGFRLVPAHAGAAGPRHTTPLPGRFVSGIIPAVRSGESALLYRAPVGRFVSGIIPAVRSGESGLLYRASVGRFVSGIIPAVRSGKSGLLYRAPVRKLGIARLTTEAMTSTAEIGLGSAACNREPPRLVCAPEPERAGRFRIRTLLQRSPSSPSNRLPAALNPLRGPSSRNASPPVAGSASTRSTAPDQRLRIKSLGRAPRAMQPSDRQV